MRKSLVILLLVELAFAVALGQVGTLHRSQLDRAFLAWHQHPTPEAREAFEKQKQIEERERWGFSLVVFAVLAGVTLLVFRIRRGEPATAGNSRRAGQLTGS